jgi:hypothetical protein
MRDLYRHLQLAGTKLPPTERKVASIEVVEPHLHAQFLLDTFYMLREDDQEKGAQSRRDVSVLHELTR